MKWKRLRRSRLSNDAPMERGDVSFVLAFGLAILAVPIAACGLVLIVGSGIWPDLRAVGLWLAWLSVGVISLSVPPFVVCLVRTRER